MYSVRTESTREPSVLLSCSPGSGGPSPSIVLSTYGLCRCPNSSGDKYCSDIPDGRRRAATSCIRSGRRHAGASVQSALLSRRDIISSRRRARSDKNAYQSNNILFHDCTISAICFSSLRLYRIVSRSSLFLFSFPSKIGLGMVPALMD